MPDAREALRLIETVKLRYVLAIVCYLAIPVAVIGGVVLIVLIDPEIARGHAGYARVFRVLETVKLAVLGAAAGVALALWLACCALVLRSRGRSWRWLTLAVAGPLGFSVIAALGDRSPVPGDHYQRFVRQLKPYWRVSLELALFAAVWLIAFNAGIVWRDVMIRLESHRTGTPVSAIAAQQTASSGMWAAGEGMEALYLVPLIYLVWPMLFNGAGWLLGAFRSRTVAGGATVP